MGRMGTVADAWEVTITRILTALGAPDDQTLNVSFQHRIRGAVSGEATFGASRLCFVLFAQIPPRNTTIEFPRAQTRLPVMGHAAMTDEGCAVHSNTLRLSWVLASTHRSSCSGRRVLSRA